MPAVLRLKAGSRPGKVVRSLREETATRAHLRPGESVGMEPTTHMLRGDSAESRTTGPSRK